MTSFVNPSIRCRHRTLFMLTVKSACSLLAVTIILLPALSFGFVIEENNYIKLTTRDSGTFIGTKEIISVVEAGPQTNEEDFVINSKAKTKSKTVKGQAPEEHFYYAFKGIPYAKPPLGKLKWKKPEVLDIKSGPVDTTKFKQICSQWDSKEGRVVGNQDCLYLNIFTPRLHFNTDHTEQNYSKYDDNPRTAVRLLPVLIYVHGGDLMFRSGNLGFPNQFMKEKVVLITFNYRLGVFGFLSTGCSKLPGNYGLYDQIFALKWIKKNIHRFGGDPTRMTVFGEVSFLLLSPMSSGLFKGAILMSSTSTAFTPGSVNTEPKKYFNAFAKTLECPNPEDVQKTIDDCLAVKPVDELIRLQQNFLKFWKYPKGVAPVIDGAHQEFGVLPTPTQELMNSTNFTDISIILGVSKLEGFEIFDEFYKKSLHDLELSELEDVTKEKLFRDLSYIEPNLTSDTFAGIWNYYFGGVDFTLSTAFEMMYLQLIHLFGDVTTYNGHWKILRALTSKNKKDVMLFNYVYDHNVELWNYVDESGRYFNNSIYPWEEEFSLFADKLLGISNQTSPNDEFETKAFAMSEPMVRLWASFAYYGSPKDAVSKSKSLNWARWPKFSQTNLNQTSYYHLRENASHTEVNFRKEENQFWSTSLPVLKKMSEEASEMEEWPILFWVSIGATILLVLFIVIIIYFIRH